MFGVPTAFRDTTPIQLEASSTSDSKYKNSRTDAQKNMNYNYIKKANQDINQNNSTNQLNKKKKKKSFTNLPVLKDKGTFFQDQFFEEFRTQFEKSVQDIVTKFGLSSFSSSKYLNNNLTKAISSSSNDIAIINNSTNSSFINAFKSYRDLRDLQLLEENQAASIEHRDHHHTIVVDVKDFMGGDFQVKVQSSKFNTIIRIEGHNDASIEGHNEAPIEGHNDASSQSSTDSSSSKQDFSRKEFTLPGPVNMGAVKSTMSSDGILAITFPRSMYVVTSPQPASSKNSLSTFPRDCDDTSQWQLNLRK